MTTLSPPAIYALAIGPGKLSPSSAIIATAIALAESGGVTDNVGDVGLEDATWGPSVGLWQIRSVKAESGTGSPRDVTRLTDPAFNAQAMAAISNGGKNWQPWTTFTNGAYSQYLGSVQSQVAAAQKKGPLPSWVTGIGNQIGGFGLPGVADAWTNGSVTQVEQTGAKKVLPWATSLGTLLSKLVDPAFWLRIGEFAAGIALIVIGFLLLARNSVESAVGSVVNPAGKVLPA